MRKFSMILVFILAFVATTLASLPAQAADSGDERFVPVIRWQCWGCDKQFFTFDPDDIEAKTKGDHKMRDYQQKNWVLFTDTGKSIPKCEKATDGAHFFDKEETFKTSPNIIYQRKNDYIVLKNGGSIKAKIAKWRCGNCKLEGHVFDGDDMDLFGTMVLTTAQDLFNMQGGGRVRDCGVKIYEGFVAKAHIMACGTATNWTSIKLAQSISNLWYSD
ncbi:hypothetical protein LJC31_04925 [Synergistaceae bacterium OttesenSCG-928-I11]|nr:hypothetical protein [Synergistaceae bacterium OttesenSCG-928-I11]